MKASEFEYLKRNGFNGESDGTICSTVIADSKFSEDGFKDAKQLSFIRTQFGDLLEKYVREMKIIVESLSDFSEYQVTLQWTYLDGYGDYVTKQSSIGGENIYDLVSQAIVLAKTE